MEAAMASPRTDTRPLYDRITDHIIADLEAGVRPWTRPWAIQADVSLPLRHTGEPYRGINVLLLWAEAVTRSYTSATWMTFRQALALGGHVRKGEHGATVVYAGQLAGRSDDDGPDDEAPGRARRFLRAYTVFNLAQIEGLPRAPAARVHVDAPSRIAAADAVFAAAGVDIRHGGDQAFYLPSRDYVQMPRLAAFPDAEAYYATLSHEGVHWTGHPTRLNRSFGSQRWGDDGYAVEELVAELGAAFLCAALGLSLTPRTEHADYLGHWLKVLRADSRALITAAAHAQRAVDYLRGGPAEEPSG